MKTFLAWLPARFQWTLHNLVAHPVSEIVYLVTGSDEGFAGWIHNITVPDHKEGEGRG